MSSKSPYEIRTDLLAMAKDYMDKQLDMNYDFTMSALHKLDENQADIAEQIEKLTPRTYSMGELIDKANELYAFVNKK